MTHATTSTQLAMRIREEIKLLIAFHREVGEVVAKDVAATVAELRKRNGTNQLWCNRIEELLSDTNEICKEMEEWCDE